MKLKIILKGNERGVPGRTTYVTEVNADNYKEVALVLMDLEKRGVPIDKSIKEYKLGKSDWEIALGF